MNLREARRLLEEIRVGRRICLASGHFEFEAIEEGFSIDDGMSADRRPTPRGSRKRDPTWIRSTARCSKTPPIDSSRLRTGFSGRRGRDARRSPAIRATRDGASKSRSWRRLERVTSSLLWNVGLCDEDFTAAWFSQESFERRRLFLDGLRGCVNVKRTRRRVSCPCGFYTGALPVVFTKQDESLRRHIKSPSCAPPCIVETMV